MRKRESRENTPRRRAASISKLLKLPQPTIIFLQFNDVLRRDSPGIELVNSANNLSS